MRNLLKKSKSNKIFASVFRSYMAVVVLVIMLACLFSFNLVRTYVINWQKNELYSKAKQVAEYVTDTPDWKVLKKFQSLIDSRIVYVNSSYVAIYAHDINPNDNNNEIRIVKEQIVSENDKKIVDAIKSAERTFSIGWIDFLKMDAAYAGLALKAGTGEIRGTILLVRPEESVIEIWRHIIKNMLIAALFALAFVLVISTLIARRFTKPLSRMQEAAHKMADGDYSTRITIHKDDEIGQLGRTLNLLSQKLEDVIESLKDEKCKLELVLYNIGEGIVSCDNHGSIIHVNDAALGFLEISCWEAKDKAYESDGKTMILSLLRRCIENAGQENAVYTNPSHRAIALLSTPVMNADEEIIGAVCLLRDVSEEMRLEQRRREYIANVSHELRTPLTGIRGMIEPLIDGIIETEEEKQESYSIIDKEAGRLEKMIGEMLELSRLQDGKNIPELERVDLYGPVSNAIRSTRMLAEKAGIDICMNAEKDIFCLSHERRIEQVIVILLDNAISFTPEGGKITVTVGRGKCKAFISVKDMGVGIEPKHLPYIWERFYKADRSRMRTRGTGLGLAIAKCVVEMLCGCISVNSELGKGTEFIVRLPYYKEET